jgi:hypothetical protein
MAPARFQNAPPGIWNHATNSAMFRGGFAAPLEKTRSKCGFASSNSPANLSFSFSFSSRSCLASSSLKFSHPAISTCASGKSTRTFRQSKGGVPSNSAIIFLRISCSGSMQSPAERSSPQTPSSFRRRSVSSFAMRTKNPDLDPAINASESGRSPGD